MIKNINHNTINQKNSSFCMAPWIHMHFLPTGKVTPCCVWPYDVTMGDVNDDSIFDIWNNEAYKKLRLKMLNNEFPQECANCTTKGSNNASTLKHFMNYKFKNHIDYMISVTKEDGSIGDFKMSYFDVRFSNICNFKCRGCSPELSSSWLDDYEKFYNFKSDKKKFVNILPNKRFLDDLMKILPTVEEAYFAGGEPLIMKEHYLILDELIKRGQTDVPIAYNTNLSTLKYKDKNIMEYWSKFRDVFLSISIDDMGPRGEYFRKGMDWEETIENIKWVKNNCPNVKVSINITVNVMNVFNVPNLHNYFLKNNLINLNNFNINLMLDPFEYSVQILPAEMKKNIVNLYSKYFFLLRSTYKIDSSNIIHKLTSILTYMNEKDQSELIPTFLERTRKLDQIRGENFELHFPELIKLKDFNNE